MPRFNSLEQFVGTSDLVSRTSKAKAESKLNSVFRVRNSPQNNLTAHLLKKILQKQNKRLQESQGGQK